MRYSAFIREVSNRFEVKLKSNINSDHFLCIIADEVAEDFFVPMYADNFKNRIYDIFEANGLSGNATMIEITPDIKGLPHVPVYSVVGNAVRLIVLQSLYHEALQEDY